MSPLLVFQIQDVTTFLSILSDSLFSSLESLEFQHNTELDFEADHRLLDVLLCLSLLCKCSLTKAEKQPRFRLIDLKNYVEVFTECKILN